MSIKEENIYSKKRKSQSTEDYLEDFIFQLESRDEDIAQAVNGNIRGDLLDEPERWTPSFDETSTGTIQYDHQTGWAYRQGIFVDVWFDIEWTSVNTLAGNIVLTVPYKVAKSQNKPFVGVVQPSGIVYTGGTEMVINGIPDTFTADFWNTGSGFTTANQLMVNAGHLIGHLRYMGQADD